MKGLTPKQAQFVQEYLLDLNATQAAIRAGYSQGTAKQIGSENLSKPAIQEAISKAMSERAAKTGVSAEWVLGQAVKMHEKCMQEEAVMGRGPDGKMEPTGEYKFDSSGAARALEIVGKHVDIQAFQDKMKLEHTGKDGGPVQFDVHFVKPKGE